MRIKDVRQGLHTLLQTEGLDGLLHLYKRLEKRGPALLLCLVTKMGKSAMRCCIIPIAAHRPTGLRRTGTIPSLLPKYVGTPGG
jgi:hypothetical protein